MPSLGKTSENVTANVDRKTAADVAMLAGVSGLSRSAYAAACLRLCADRGYIFKQDTAALIAYVDAIQSGTARPIVPLVLGAWNETAPDGPVPRPFALNDGSARDKTPTTHDAAAPASVNYRKGKKRNTP